MPTLAITAIGADRPGIVAALTGVLVDAGCNLEDTSMSILGGHFAMVLIVDAPPAVDPSSLGDALVTATADLGLVIAVGDVGDAHGPDRADQGEAWTLVVYGADHPGIVAGITAALAARSVNIVDLTTRVTGEERPIYAMVMEVVPPAGLAVDDLRTALAEEGARLGVDWTLHPSEPDIL